MKTKVDGKGCHWRGNDMGKLEAAFNPEVSGVCAECGQRFKLERGRKRFCSKSCYDRFRNSDYMERQRYGEAKRCPMCGRSFKGRMNQVCCSLTCARALDHRKRQI